MAETGNPEEIAGEWPPCRIAAWPGDREAQGDSACGAGAAGGGARAGADRQAEPPAMAAGYRGWTMASASISTS